MRRIYLDNASLTPVRKEVIKEMIAYSSLEYGNPSSLHFEGVNAKKALLEARTTVAQKIYAHSSEIIFTGSGTEANNIAILGSIEALVANGQTYETLHAVTTVIEHASVLETFKELARRGVNVSYIPVLPNGVIDIKEFKKSLRKETVLVSVMYVNNEIGTIQPISEISKIIQRAPGDIKPLLHVDASQAPLYLELNVEKLGADLLTLDGQKMYGPRGIGMLYIKKGTPLVPIMRGGGQEKGLRSSTENIPAIMGFAKALTYAVEEREKESVRLSLLRDYCFGRLTSECNAQINGDTLLRAANNVHISISGSESELLVLRLDAKGISVSTKSSCLKDEEESYVLRALGKKDPTNGLRITLGRTTSKKDIDYLVKTLATLI